MVHYYGECKCSSFLHTRAESKVTWTKSLITPSMLKPILLRSSCLQDTILRRVHKYFTKGFIPNILIFETTKCRLIIWSVQCLGIYMSSLMVRDQNLHDFQCLTCQCMEKDLGNRESIYSHFSLGDFNMYLPSASPYTPPLT